ncbi:hypothetical protein [Sphaerimonospora mesophila]|uniref:hypothetical protein n=1 Tax=Sphaerimonospora mesophila TaxID=37483 RepID=UPI0013665E8E
MGLARAGGPEPPPGPPMLRPGVLLATFDRPMAEVLRLVIDGRASGERVRRPHAGWTVT